MTVKPDFMEKVHDALAMADVTEGHVEGLDEEGTRFFAVMRFTDGTPEAEVFDSYLEARQELIDLGCHVQYDNSGSDHDSYWISFSIPKEHHMPQDQTSVNAVLAERGSRYGRFFDHATICQDLKAVIDRELGLKGKRLPSDMKQSLDVICDKIARIINGDHNYTDNWTDIAGYAQLILDRLEGKGIYSRKESDNSGDDK